MSPLSIFASTELTACSFSSRSRNSRSTASRNSPRFVTPDGVAHGDEHVRAGLHQHALIDGDVNFAFASIS